MNDTRYFIKKDFIGYPVGIVVAKYDNGKKVSGDFIAPRNLNKFKGFSCLDEVRKYKICSCGKANCGANIQLVSLVDEFYNPPSLV